MLRLPEPLDWLAAGVPLTLMVDLLGTDAPDSANIYREEHADDAWLHPTPHAA